MTDSPDSPPPGKEIATLGAGCFWCIEAAFDMLKGVESVESGYMGGIHPNPSYEAVCTGVTGHAEVVQVTFDPSAISFRDILHVFFSLHDPTTLNRQGNDVGTQYRSVTGTGKDSERGHRRPHCRQAVRCAHCHGSLPRTTLLYGRGLSPRIFCAESHAALLLVSHWSQNREIPETI